MRGGGRVGNERASGHRKWSRNEVERKVHGSLERMTGFARRNNLRIATEDGNYEHGQMERVAVLQPDVAGID